jgi:hypothetical protein
VWLENPQATAISMSGVDRSFIIRTAFSNHRSRLSQDKEPAQRIVGLLTSLCNGVPKGLGGGMLLSN